MAFKMFSTGLLLAFAAGMCLCQQQPQQQQQQPTASSQYPQSAASAAVSQASFQIGSAVVPQTKLEDIERDSLNAAAYGQKTQQPTGKSTTSATSATQQQQAQPQAYQTVPQQQQYFVQPYSAVAPQQQYYVQPYQAQPYQAAFDYSGVQYMFINPNAYQGTNQVYQPYYVPSLPTPSAVPQYVTKQSSSATKTTATAPAQAQQEYKQFAAPAQAQQEYKQSQFVVPAQVQQEYKQFAVPAQAQQEYKQFTAPAQAQQEYRQQQFAVPSQAQQQQQYIFPAAPAYQYVQQPETSARATSAAAPTGSLDFSYVTRHPAATAAQFKTSAPATTTAGQSQFQYTALPQQYQQPQYYFTLPATETGAAAAASGQVFAERPRIQQSAKSQFSSGIKSTTASPVKDSFAYKFESSPLQQQQQQQQSSGAYNTLRYSA